MRRIWILVMLLASCAHTEKNVSPAIVKPANFIAVVLSVRATNADSVFASVTFTNRSADDFILYRALLPSDTPDISLFVVQEVESLDGTKYFGKQSEPCLIGISDTCYVMPDLGPQNLLAVHPHQTVSFTCNLAEQYDFKEILMKGLRHFRIRYLAINPAIADAKQIMERDPSDNKSKPVYYSLMSMSNDSRDSEWAYVRIASIGPVKKTDTINSSGDTHP